MTNNTKQGLIVIGITVVPFLIIGFLGFRQHLRAEERAADSSVENSLKQSYQEIITNRSTTPISTSVMTTQKSQSAFLNQEREALKSTGFLGPNEIWIAKESVKLNSTNLLCVAVVFDGGRIGIDGSGTYRHVSDQEFTNWPHVSAKELHP